MYCYIFALILTTTIQIMTKAQSKLDSQLKKGSLITQSNNRLWIESEVLNTKTLISYIQKNYTEDYRIVLKKIVTIN